MANEVRFSNNRVQSLLKFRLIDQRLNCVLDTNPSYRAPAANARYALIKMMEEERARQAQRRAGHKHRRWGTEARVARYVQLIPKTNARASVDGAPAMGGGSCRTL